jgi:uncharacterized protein DUF3107
VAGDQRLAAPLITGPGQISPRRAGGIAGSEEPVEVKIGIQSIARELALETNESPEEVERRLAAAVADGGLFVLHDDKGGAALIPAGKIGYVEFSGLEQRRVGFSSVYK